MTAAGKVKARGCTHGPEHQQLGEAMSNNIVQQVEGELRASSLDIALHTGNEHRAVLQLVNAHLEDFETFGQVAFEMRAGYNNAQVKIAQLNEPQATLLITFMKNTPIVRGFKVELVRQFQEMKKALTPAFALPQSFSEALRELAATVETNAALEAKVTEDAPKVAYVDRFVGERSDIITVDVFAGQFGSTGPKVRDLLHEKGLASRKIIGERWSDSKQEMEDVYEWRARQGRPTTGWFDLLPQNKVPRLHNGQVRQTMYVRQFHAEALAAKLGLTSSKEIAA